MTTMMMMSLEQYTTISTGNDSDSSCIMQGILPTDILCGRCKTAFNHIGNRRFREVIGMNIPKYFEAKSRHEKSALIISVVRMLQEEVGARFMKKKGKSYIELNEKQAREKVGHALRDLAVQKQQSTKKEETKTKMQKVDVRVVKKSLFDKVLPGELFSVDMSGDDVLSMENFFETATAMIDPIPLGDVQAENAVDETWIGNFFDICDDIDTFEPLPLHCAASQA